MSTIYLDESGDLGFSFEKNSSKYFVIALFETSLTEKELKKIIKITKERTIKKKEDRKYELKGSCENTKFETKKFLLKELIKKEATFKINAIIVNKKNINNNLRDKSRAFYNYICKEILKENNKSKIKLILDKKDIKEKFLQDMNKYLIEIFNTKELELSHEFSHSFAGLQVVDIIANSIFRNFEREDNKLYTIFENNLVLKKYYFN